MFLASNLVYLWISCGNNICLTCFQSKSWYWFWAFTFVRRDLKFNVFERVQNRLSAILLRCELIFQLTKNWHFFEHSIAKSASELPEVSLGIRLNSKLTLSEMSCFRPSHLRNTMRIYKCEFTGAAIIGMFPKFFFLLFGHPRFYGRFSFGVNMRFIYGLEWHCHPRLPK